MRKLLLFAAILTISTSSLSAQCTSVTRDGIHVVQYGETLFRISKLYNVTIDDLREWNGMQFNEILSVCQELRIMPNNTTETVVSTQPEQEVFVTRGVPTAIPASQSIPVTTTRTTVGNKPYSSYQRQAGGKHVIGQGESIANIARLYGYTEERFREFNVLRPGQELAPGSVLLSTDCSCSRVSYSEHSKGLFDGQWNEQLIARSDDVYYHKRYDNSGATTHTAGTNGTYHNPHYTPPSASQNQPTTTNYNGNGAQTSWGRVGTSTNQPSTSTNTYNNNSTGNTTNTDWQRNSSGSGPATTTNRTNPTAYNNERAASNYMSNEEQAMIQEINLIRANPAGYIPYVEQYIRDIRSGKAFGSSTTAAYELIDELKKTPALSVLQPVECLYQAARKHGQEAVSKGSSDHQGLDGSWPWDRVKRGCTQMQDGNENLVGGPSNIREAVMLLLVDDGITNRGHRKTLLNKDWKYVACYKSGQVGRMPNSWVQLFGY